MTPELDHLSYSSISMYLTCARSWRFKYLEQAPTIASPELVFGSAIHSAVENYLGQAITADRAKELASSVRLLLQG